MTSALVPLLVLLTIVSLGIFLIPFNLWRQNKGEPVRELPPAQALIGKERLRLRPRADPVPGLFLVCLPTALVMLVTLLALTSL